MLRWMLAVGTGGAFTLATFAFAAAWTDRARLECGAFPDAGNCRDAAMTLVICGLVGAAMLIVFAILLRQVRGPRDA